MKKILTQLAISMALATAFMTEAAADKPKPAPSSAVLPDLFAQAKRAMAAGAVARGVGPFPGGTGGGFIWSGFERKNHRGPGRIDKVAFFGGDPEIFIREKAMEQAKLEKADLDRDWQAFMTIPNPELNRLGVRLIPGHLQTIEDLLALAGAGPDRPAEFRRGLATLGFAPGAFENLVIQFNQVSPIPVLPLTPSRRP